MKVNQEQFLQQLIENVEDNLTSVNEYMELSDEELNTKYDEKSWSILECMEHLNRYGDYYIPYLKKAMNTSPQKTKDIYKGGWLGNYFANMMQPKGGSISNKMSAPSDKNPIGTTLDRVVLSVRKEQCTQLLEILGHSFDKNINKPRIPISISRVIRLKYGDTLHFLIAHDNRHTLQGDRIMYSISNKNTI
ncbi:DinB family protein [Flammeovirga sp. SubArs3]|uniref:DinB family protein n=1 Tax=Flammeovirga sp. SubArs3 TaxID=2995316 RepID=UPI00248B2468|nr:DinB family protein [Flammeovirga sp. SubArs3]